MKVRRLPNVGPTHHRQYIQSNGNYLWNTHTKSPERTDSRHPTVVSSWGSLHKEKNRKSLVPMRGHRKAQ
jgi:hypothetical protein